MAKAKKGPVQFINEVKIEAKKVTWPSKHEVLVSMISVFIMVFVASIFLYFADQLIAWSIVKIMGFGG